MRKAAAEQVEAATELLTRHRRSASVFRQPAPDDETPTAFGAASDAAVSNP